MKSARCLRHSYYAWAFFGFSFGLCWASLSHMLIEQSFDMLFLAIVGMVLMLNSVFQAPAIKHIKKDFWAHPDYPGSFIQITKWE